MLEFYHSTSLVTMDEIVSLTKRQHAIVCPKPKHRTLEQSVG